MPEMEIDEQSLFDAAVSDEPVEVEVREVPEAPEPEAGQPRDEHGKFAKSGQLKLAMALNRACRQIDLYFSIDCGVVGGDSAAYDERTIVALLAVSSSLPICAPFRWPILKLANSG